MIVQSQTRAEGAGAIQTYSFTFGHHQQKDGWSDVRALTWPQLAELLTTHAVGPKTGTCIVPAVFSGARRQKAEAERIDVAFLDSDGGATLAEIQAAIAAHGWTAIVSSTHSHLTTRTQAKRDRWQRDAGLRIDHVLLSTSLRHRLADAGVDRHVRGLEGASDHAPVWVTLGARAPARKRGWPAAR